MFPTHFPFMRDAMGLRAALLPHLYTAARLFYDTAVAPVRALYIDFPQEALAYSQRHTYMFGDILVSPIHTFSVDGLSSVSVSVWLPKGHWAPWSGTDPVIVSTGLGYFTRDYGQSEIPIFVRADALLPLALHGAADIVETSPDIAWTVWDAGAQYGGGSLYEDDGFSQRYRGGGANAALVTEADFSWGATNLTLRVDTPKGTYAGAPSSRAHALHVRGWGRARKPPSAVFFNGMPVSQGNSTPGWLIFSVKPGEPALTAPDGMLQVLVGSIAMDDPFTVQVLF